MLFNKSLVGMEVFVLSLTKEQVERVAHLARLNLTEQEKEKMIIDLGAIIGWADELGTLDIQNVEPTAHIIPIHNVFRLDAVKPSMDLELLLSNAPSQESGCFSVPKIVE